MPVYNALVGGEPQIQDCEIWRRQTIETSIYRIVQNRKYFDILNLFGMTHECDGQTDGQTVANFILRQRNQSESIRKSVYLLES